MSVDHEIDIPLLQDNLALSPIERLEAHQKALDLLLAIDEARKNIYEKPKQPAQTPTRK